jgi:hypothetical protein
VGGGLSGFEVEGVKADFGESWGGKVDFSPFFHVFLLQFLFLFLSLI